MSNDLTYLEDQELILLYPVGSRWVSYISEEEEIEYDYMFTIIGFNEDRYFNAADEEVITIILQLSYHDDPEVYEVSVLDFHHEILGHHHRRVRNRFIMKQADPIVLFKMK